MPKVAVIGLGIMGSAIAANLAAADLPVTGFDIVAARRRACARTGAIAASSVRDAVRRADVAITSLPSAAALHDVAAAIADAAHRPAVVIDTSTLPIAEKIVARDRLRATGVTLLDCPVSGTGAQARTRDLAVYASGSRAAYRKVVPVLSAFARAHYYLGAFGTGSRMKFVANLLVAIHNVAAAEALVLAMKAGLDPETVVKVVGDGAGASRVLQLRGPMMARGRYADATMKLSVFEKDLAIISEFAREIGSPTPLFAAAAPIYRAALAGGRGDEDTAAVCAVLEAMAKHRRPRN